VCYLIIYLSLKVLRRVCVCELCVVCPVTSTGISFLVSKFFLFFFPLYVCSIFFYFLNLLICAQISSATPSRTRICGGRCQDFILCRVALPSAQCDAIFIFWSYCYLPIVSLLCSVLCAPFLLVVAVVLSCLSPAVCLCSWVIDGHVSYGIIDDWLSLNFCILVWYFSLSSGASI